MLKLVSDENFDGDILRALYRRRPDANVVSVEDIGLNATHDLVRRRIEKGLD